MAYARKREVSAAERLPVEVLVSRLQSPEISESLQKLRDQYGKYALPAASLRKMVDRDMGKKTLTGELHAMREGR